MSDETIAVEISHKVCGHVFGAFGALDDHGSFDVFCPKCKQWTTIHSQLIMYPGNIDNAEASHVVYKDVSDLFDNDTGLLKEIK